MPAATRPRHLHSVPLDNEETQSQGTSTSTVAWTPPVIPMVYPQTASSIPAAATAADFAVSPPPAGDGKVPEDIDLEQLYPASAELNTLLSRAYILLGQALQRLDRAIDYCRSGDPILADDQVNHLRVVLDELFCARELSEGFASVVNACSNGIRNLHGAMAEEKQLLALNSCVLALRKKPLISFDASLEMIDRLEASGFDVDAAGTDVVIDCFTNESLG